MRWQTSNKTKMPVSSSLVVRYCLMAVTRFPAGDMEPPASIAHGMLKEQLVEIKILFNEAKHLLPHLGRRDVNVGGLTAQMLGGRAPSNGGIETRTAIATGDANHAKMAPQGFQHLLGQQPKTVDDGRIGRCVVDVTAQGYTGNNKFAKSEMRRELCLKLGPQDRFCVVHRILFHLFDPAKMRKKRQTANSQLHHDQDRHWNAQTLFSRFPLL